MRIKSRKISPKTVGFLYADRSSVVIRLEGIGEERAENQAYRWNGLERGQHGSAIFQITLQGRGEIRFGETVYALPKNHAFLCRIPGDHEYYLPEGEAFWEFLFITVHGEDALRHWMELERKLGHVFELPPKSELLKLLSGLLEDIVESPLVDSFELSATLYRMVLELHRIADAAEPIQNDMPAPLRRAIDLIRERYREDLSLEALAAFSGLSKYHFCRLFQKKMGIKPMRFIRHVRIEQAVLLLSQTDMPIAKVGEACGFSHTNYFIKTFRELVGVTPGEFRRSPEHLSFGQWKVGR
ncbi:hypothetical protein PA598K_02867 [Paenibacillus sp. 598K]|nr:hypothetical protein PA598K_02867 [Paenibacillus sp. 598K]